MLINHILSEQKDAKITAVSRKVEELKLLPPKVTTIATDVSNEIMVSAIKDDFDYVIHCASETKSQNMVSYPVETAIGIADGTKNVLELAKRCHVRSMVYLSSMEVYGSSDTFDHRRISEHELGNVDILM